MKPVIIIAIAFVFLFVPTNAFGFVSIGDLEGHVMILTQWTGQLFLLHPIQNAQIETLRLYCFLRSR